MYCCKVANAVGEKICSSTAVPLCKSICKYFLYTIVCARAKKETRESCYLGLKAGSRPTAGCCNLKMHYSNRNGNDIVSCSFAGAPTNYVICRPSRFDIESLLTPVSTPCRSRFWDDDGEIGQQGVSPTSGRYDGALPRALERVFCWLEEVEAGLYVSGEFVQAI